MLNFSNPNQEILYSNLIKRNKGDQKFIDVQPLKDLLLYKGVCQLLHNMGWEGLLTLHAKSYQTPMLEFLYSTHLDHSMRILSFLLPNQFHQINVDGICDIIGAPKGANKYVKKRKTQT